jgi:hypothetical protein
MFLCPVYKVKNGRYLSLVNFEARDVLDTSIFVQVGNKFAEIHCLINKYTNYN